jgi:cytochrome P450
MDAGALGSGRMLAKKDKVMLGGYELHKGTDVAIPYYPIFRGCGIENPDSFDPERCVSSTASFAACRMCVYYVI